MLNAFKEVIRDYRTPPAKALNRDLESKLRPQIQYLVDCRPVGINMGNAIKWLKVRARAGGSRGDDGCRARTRRPRARHTAGLLPCLCLCSHVLVDSRHLRARQSRADRARSLACESALRRCPAPPRIASRPCATWTPVTQHP
jgi:hypothetical protein